MRISPFNLQLLSVCFFFTVFAAVNFFFLVCQNKDVGQALLNGGNATGISAVDNIGNGLGKNQFLFVHDFTVLDDVYGDVVVNECQDVQVKLVDVAFHFKNILFAHFITAGIFNNGNGAV